MENHRLTIVLLLHLFFVLEEVPVDGVNDDEVLAAGEHAVQVVVGV